MKTQMIKRSAPAFCLFTFVFLLSSCGLVGQQRLATQLQAPLTLPPIVVSDAQIVQITANLTSQWGRKNDISELFSYGAEVSLAGLTTALLSAQDPQTKAGLAIGSAIWLALLKIFQPDARGLVYVEGLEDLTDGLTAYILCMANDKRVVVPAKQFTPCGAHLFVTVGAAANNVSRGLWGLRPRRSDLDRVQPLAIEGQPRTLQMPRSAVAVP